MDTDAMQILGILFGVLSYVGVCLIGYSMRSCVYSYHSH
jgi:hypothetical protein